MDRPNYGPPAWGKKPLAFESETPKLISSAWSRARARGTEEKLSGTQGCSREGAPQPASSWQACQLLNWVQLGWPEWARGKRLAGCLKGPLREATSLCSQRDLQDHIQVPRTRTTRGTAGARCFPPRPPQDPALSSEELQIRLQDEAPSQHFWASKTKQMGACPLFPPAPSPVLTTFSLVFILSSPAICGAVTHPVCGDAAALLAVERL